MSENIEDFETQGPAEKKARRKWPIVLGVVAVLLVSAGAGLMVWHEQPSFCNAICHEPMGSYVDEYYSEDRSLLAVVHRQADVECLDCHEPTFSDQVSEGIAWITGDFYAEPEKRDFANDAFCLNEACHVKEGIAQATEDWGGNDFNPHASHMGKDITCGDCHSMHRESSVYCNKCHNADLPEGWVNPTG